MDYQGLYELINKELTALAFKKNYPINPHLALQGFFRAFRCSNATVILDDSSQTAEIYHKKELGGELDLLKSRIDFYNLLRGKSEGKPYTPCSVKSLNDSIDNIFNQFGKSVKLNLKKKLDWFMIRSREIERVKKNLAGEFESYVDKYQESMFVPRNGIALELKELKEADLFYFMLRESTSGKIIDDPLDLNQGDILDSEEERNVEAQPKQGKRMSEEERFLGLYLDRFARMKDYLLVTAISRQSLTDIRQRISYLSLNGIDAFEEAKYVWTNQQRCFI